jgi:hypothetical protein
MVHGASSCCAVSRSSSTAAAAAAGMEADLLLQSLLLNYMDPTTLNEQVYRYCV